jgi:hypothetical protein
MLHNFGGNIEMYGVLDSISSGPIDARTSYNSTMVHFTFISYVYLLTVGVSFAFSLEKHILLFSLMGVLIVYPFSYLGWCWHVHGGNRA